MVIVEAVLSIVTDTASSELTGKVPASVFEYFAVAGEPTVSSEVNSISGLIEIFAPLGIELGTSGGVDDPPPPPPQLARHETIIEESSNLSNFIFVVLKKVSSAKPRIPLMFKKFGYELGYFEGNPSGILLYSFHMPLSSSSVITPSSSSVKPS